MVQMWSHPLVVENTECSLIDGCKIPTDPYELPQCLTSGFVHMGRGGQVIGYPKTDILLCDDRINQCSIYAVCASPSTLTG